MTKRAFRAVVAAILMSVWLLGANPQITLASCNPGRPNVSFGGFAGTQSSPAPAPDGIRADVEDYEPYVTEGSQVSVWVVLNRGTTRWAQIGWIRWKDAGVYAKSTFEQHVTDAGQVVTNYTTRLYGTVNYRIDWTPSTNRFSLKRNGVEYWAVTLAWDPLTYEVYGETHREFDQMPGHYGGPMEFTNTYASLTGSSTWSSLTSSAGSNANDWYGAARVNGLRYQVWDKQCSS